MWTPARPATCRPTCARRLPAHRKRRAYRSSTWTDAGSNPILTTTWPPLWPALTKARGGVRGSVPRGRHATMCQLSVAASVGLIAKAAGNAIPGGHRGAEADGEGVRARVHRRGKRAGHQAHRGALRSRRKTAGSGIHEPIELTEEARATLDARMGAWVAAACRGKRLALPSAFPVSCAVRWRWKPIASSNSTAGVNLLFFF